MEFCEEEFISVKISQLQPYIVDKCQNIKLNEKHKVQR